ncbi:MAG: hypothetical protein HYS32_01310 [Candidatus Woesearchaeota archaeon]|nr:MAG: hypothetical protein HYS32_01310 [Candidatus Woesearchaeota archaeon]
MIVNKLKISLTLAIFEASTLFILGLTKSFNLILTALLVGLLGSLIAVFIHNLLSKKFTLMSINSKKIFFPYNFPIFLSIFLIILFTTQLFLPFPDSLLGNFFLGFTSAFIASLICLSIYNIQPLKIKFNKIKITQTNVLNTSLFVGLYEAFILPIMNPLMQINYPLAGFISGLAGGFIATSIYNKSKLKIKWK